MQCYSTLQLKPRPGIGFVQFTHFNAAKPEYMCITTECVEGKGTSTPQFCMPLALCTYNSGLPLSSTVTKVVKTKGFLHMGTGTLVGNTTRAELWTNSWLLSMYVYIEESDVVHTAHTHRTVDLNFCPFPCLLPCVAVWHCIATAGRIYLCQILNSGP